MSQVKIHFIPRVVLNPKMVEEMARNAALVDASRPHLRAPGFLGILGLAAAGWLLFRATR